MYLSRLVYSGHILRHDIWWLISNKRKQWLLWLGNKLSLTGDLKSVLIQQEDYHLTELPYSTDAIPVRFRAFLDWFHSSMWINKKLQLVSFLVSFYFWIFLFFVSHVFFIFTAKLQTKTFLSGFYSTFANLFASFFFFCNIAHLFLWQISCNLTFSFNTHIYSIILLFLIWI